MYNTLKFMNFWKTIEIDEPIIVHNLWPIYIHGYEGIFSLQKYDKYTLYCIRNNTDYVFQLKEFKNFADFGMRSSSDQINRMKLITLIKEQTK